MLDAGEVDPIINTILEDDLNMMKIYLEFILSKPEISNKFNSLYYFQFRTTIPWRENSSGKIIIDYNLNHWSIMQSI